MPDRQRAHHPAEVLICEGNTRFTLILSNPKCFVQFRVDFVDRFAVLKLLKNPSQETTGQRNLLDMSPDIA